MSTSTNPICQKPDLADPVFGRMKRIKVYLMDEPDTCNLLNIIPRHLRSWTAILKFITDTLKPSFGAVKRLIELSSGKYIEAFEDLKLNETYIALGTHGTVKKEPGCYMLYNKSEIFKRKERKQLYLGTHDPKMREFLEETKDKGLTVIYVLINGVSHQVPQKVVLRKRDLESWDIILRFLDKKLDIPESIAYIATIFGKILLEPTDLQHGFVYVAVQPLMTFVRLNYLDLFKYLCSNYRGNYVSSIKAATSTKAKRKRAAKKKASSQKSSKRSKNKDDNGESINSQKPDNSKHDSDEGLDAASSRSPQKSQIPQNDNPDSRESINHTLDEESKKADEYHEKNEHKDEIDALGKKEGSTKLSKVPVSQGDDKQLGKLPQSYCCNPNCDRQNHEDVSPKRNHEDVSPKRNHEDVSPKRNHEDVSPNTQVRKSKLSNCFKAKCASLKHGLKVQHELSNVTKAKHQMSDYCCNPGCNVNNLTTSKRPSDCDADNMSNDSTVEHEMSDYCCNHRCIVHNSTPSKHTLRCCNSNCDVSCRSNDSNVENEMSDYCCNLLCNNNNLIESKQPSRCCNTNCNAGTTTNDLKTDHQTPVHSCKASCNTNNLNQSKQPSRCCNTNCDAGTTTTDLKAENGTSVYSCKGACNTNNLNQSKQPSRCCNTNCDAGTTTNDLKAENGTSVYSCKGTCNTNNLNQSKQPSHCCNTDCDAGTTTNDLKTDHETPVCSCNDNVNESKQPLCYCISNSNAGSISSDAKAENATLLYCCNPSCSNNNINESEQQYRCCNRNCDIDSMSNDSKAESKMSVNCCNLKCSTNNLNEPKKSSRCCNFNCDSATRTNDPNRDHQTSVYCYSLRCITDHSAESNKAFKKYGGKVKSCFQNRNLKTRKDPLYCYDAKQHSLHIDETHKNGLQSPNCFCNEKSTTYYGNTWDCYSNCRCGEMEQEEPERDTNKHVPSSVDESKSNLENGSQTLPDVGLERFLDTHAQLNPELQPEIGQKLDDTEPQLEVEPKNKPQQLNNIKPQLKVKQKTSLQKLNKNGPMPVMTNALARMKHVLKASCIHRTCQRSYIRYCPYTNQRPCRNVQCCRLYLKHYRNNNCQLFRCEQKIKRTFGAFKKRLPTACR